MYEHYEELLIPPASIINKSLYLSIYLLTKNIILQKIKNIESKDNEEKAQIQGTWKFSQKLQNFIDAINKEIGEEYKHKHISKEYTIENLKNILDYLKSQNSIFAGDILEGILIHIFSFAFKASKENSFGEFIYRGINGKFKLEESNNFDVANWFIKEKFIPMELQNLKNLITDDDKEENEIKNSTLYKILQEIMKEKYRNFGKKNNKIIDQYIYRRNFDSQEILDINFTKNFQPKKLIRHFLISVFIYYQNKNSPLMKYIKKDNDKYKENDKNDKEKNEINEKNDNKDNKKEDDEKEKKELAVIPFDYNLDEAQLDFKFANTVLSPVKIEPRISKISMSQNKLGEGGFYELSKSLLFNRNIKRCILDTSTIKSYYLDYLDLGLGIYDNFNLEELNLSYNSMNKDSEIYLSRIISHLKGLKTINLSSNDLKEGVSSFFVMLKKLFRKKETCLENLILNKCNLDNSSFYELGELLKSKFCGLKRLYLNANIIPSQAHFLKKLKKNRCLTEIYLNKSNINEKNIDEVMRLISNTHIETLYIYKNKITNFNDCLRIIYRTKLIPEKNRELNFLKDESFLLNIDLSDNNCSHKNISQIRLLDEIINETTLYCIDLSHILLGNNPEKITATSENSEYRNQVKNLSYKLNKEKEEYEQKIWDLKCYNCDKKELETQIENMLKNELNKYNKEILQELGEDRIDLILEDRNAKHSMFLREKAKEIIFGILSYKGPSKPNYDLIKEKLINEEEKKDEEKKEDKNNEENPEEKKGKNNINKEEFNLLVKFLLCKINLKRIENILNKSKNIKKDKKLVII